MPTTTLSNKLIAVLLSFALVFSFTPSIAFADNETNSQTTAEEAGSGENSTNENTADSSLTDGTDPSDSSTNNQDNSTSSTSTSVSDGSKQVSSNARTVSNDNNQTNTETADNEANDQANSWRYIDGEQIYSYGGASTEAVDPNMPMPLAAAPGASSYATWYKSNGTTSYTYKETPSSSGQNISVSGVKRVGIDVSYHQGTIDWAKVKNSGVSFAIIRCGYGSNLTSQDDTQFLNNVRGAQANGIDIGIYLYSYAKNTTGNDSSATSEAQHVLRLLNEAGLEPSDLAYPVYYDLEENSQASLGPSKIADLATTFCNIISDAGYDVGIYANQNWWRNYLTDSVFSTAGWNKWVARYPGSNKATDSGVSGTEIWQFSDCGNVDGINGNCDMNFDYTNHYGWSMESGRWYWYDTNGKKTTGWNLIDGVWYFFNQSGAMETDWEYINGKWYYLYPSWGGMATGWINLGGTYYFLDQNGAMLTGWQEYNGNTYYLDASGAMAVGWKEINGQWYHFANWGGMQTGWINLSGTWYYLDSDGIMLKGLQTINGCEYYFMESGETKGAMKTGWQMLDGVWYYFANWGGMEKNKWINLGGTYYFLDQNGAMLTGWQEYNGNTYYLDASGAMAVGWKEINGQWYHFANWGGMQTGWINLSGTWYYLDSDGIMLKGLQTINGALYYLSESGDYKGSMWANCQVRLEGNTCGYASAWGAIYRLGVYDGDNVILTKENGEILSGWQYIGNRWFYGEPGTGVMHIGWLKLGSTWYYLSSSGAMVTGWQTIDGKSYYFTSSGVWVDGGAMAIKAQGYTSGTNYLIMVDCSAHKVGVFRGSVNNWSLQYSWRCVTGAPSTPTIKGTFRTTGFKRNSLSTDSRAIYCTQIWGGYFFHSILASESELGQSLSHGCIRLPYSAAQWIHSNIYAGTTVVIYN